MNLVLGIAVLSLGLMPTIGMADGPDYQPPEGPKYEHPNHPPQGPKSAPKGKAYGSLLPRAEQETRERREGDCVQPLRQSNGPGGQERQRDREEGVQGTKARSPVKGVKGNAFQQLRQRGVNQLRREEAAVGRRQFGGPT